MIIASYWCYLVFLACYNMRAVGWRFHIKAVKAKVIPISRKSYKCSLNNDLYKLLKRVILCGVLEFFKNITGIFTSFRIAKVSITALGARDCDVSRRTSFPVHTALLQEGELT